MVDFDESILIECLPHFSYYHNPDADEKHGQWEHERYDLEQFAERSVAVCPECDHDGTVAEFRVQ